MRFVAPSAASSGVAPATANSGAVKATESARKRRRVSASVCIAGRVVISSREVESEANGAKCIHAGFYKRLKLWTGLLGSSPRYGKRTAKDWLERALR